MNNMMKGKIKMRKTCKVKEIIEYSNSQLSREDLGDEAKLGICMVLEKILFNSGNYNGFQHRHWWTGGGIAEFEEACANGLADKNKVPADQYFLGPKLQQYDRIYQNGGAGKPPPLGGG